MAASRNQQGGPDYVGMLTHFYSAFVPDKVCRASILVKFLVIAYRGHAGW